MILLIGLLLLAILAVFTVQNWAPAVPLVVFGSQTAALPIALWVIGAILAGALTVLLMALLLRLVGTPPSMGRSGTSYSDGTRARRRYVVEDDQDPEVRDGGGGVSPRYGRPRNPYVDPVDTSLGDGGSGDEGDPSARARSTFQPAGDNWESFSRPRREWADWGRPSAGASPGVDQVLEVNSVEPPEADDEDWNWSSYEPAKAGPRGSAGRDAGRYAADYSDGYSSDYPDNYPDNYPDDNADIDARDYTEDYAEDYAGPYEPAYREERWSAPEPPSYGAPPQRAAASYRGDRNIDPVIDPIEESDRGFASEDFPASGDDYEPDPEPSYSPDYGSDYSSYGPGYGSDDAEPADSTDEAFFEDGGPTAADSDYEDYIIDYGSEAEIDQFDPAAARRSRSASNESVGPDDSVSPDEDADWSDWEETPPETDPPAPTRDIYEVPTAPKAVSRSGSVYAYRYRSEAAEAVEAAESSSADASDSPAEDDDSPRRTLIPPPPTDDQPTP